ncbi:hypothetical protein L1049_023744 [Liquidambar formosana]|uniref:Uncharacterized protein n=1 Tax=Liquidambar formosana TaxID=63359 RepID=A0AAP0S013_LIQFO
MVLKDQRPEPEMEKPKGKRMNMKSHLCIPRLRINTCTTTTTTNSKRVSPMSLLERLREAVFRLIMLTAISKASQNTGSAEANRSYHPPDPHHSEAVAECIEFIKKTSASSTDDNRDSTASSSSIDATPEVIIPVPVM